MNENDLNKIEKIVNSKTKYASYLNHLKNIESDVIALYRLGIPENEIIPLYLGINNIKSLVLNYELLRNKVTETKQQLLNESELEIEKLKKQFNILNKSIDKGNR